MKKKVLRPLRSFVLLFLAAALCCNPALTHAAEPLRVEVGQIPLLWFSQPSVIKGEGWDREAGLDLSLQIFPGPPPMIQAFAGGKLDVLYNNVAAALILKDKGVDIQVLAGSLRGDTLLIGRAPLTDMAKALGPVEAIRKRAQELGRPLKLATYPKGSLGDIIVRRWVEAAFGADQKLVEIINTGSHELYQQAILSESVDLISAYWEILVNFSQKDPRLGLIARPEVLMANQPGGIVGVRGSFARAHPGAAQKLLELHRRATRFVRENPARAAAHFHKYVAHGLVDEKVLEDSIRIAPERFDDRLGPLRASIQTIADFMVGHGYLSKPTDAARIVPVD